jgi:RNA polymerase sigma-70 factor (ECF subfamily)
MTNDLQLWRALKAGDKKALAAIYQQEVDALFRYGCQITADQALVEDSIQDLFIELWKNRATLGDTDAIRQYLLVALRRKIIRHLKQGVNRTERHLKVVDANAHTAAVDERVIAAEETESQQKTVSKALSLLSERQREILYLRYFEEMDYQHIATVLGINYQSVRNTASAGMKALRKLLGILFLFFAQ